MTRIVVKKSGELIIGFELDGHTGYGVEGEDIVCAGLSSIAQTACLGLLLIAKANVNIVRENDDAYLKCCLPNNLNSKVMHDCQVILNTALLGFSDLKEGYSDFIELEVEEYVY